MKRHIVFATTAHAINTLKSFQEWRERIELIVPPSLVNKPELKGINFHTPSEKPAEEFGDTTTVLLDDDVTLIDSQLLDFFAQTKTRFVPLNQWVVEMLENPSVLIAPESVRLDICTRCQLNCVYCYMRHDKRETTGTGHVTPLQFEAFLERNPYVRHVEISNSGEPFLHPQMHKIIEIAYKHNVHLTCYNGANFNHVTNKTLEALVDYKFVHINVALDGARQETYSIYRRKGNFNKVVANIKKLNEIKKRKNSDYPKLYWQFIVMSHNYDDVPLAEKMAKELGMTISFRDTWDPNEKRRLEKMLSERRAKHGEEQDPSSKIIEDRKNTFNFWCRELLLHPQINWDGRLLGCCQVYRSDWGVNVFDVGLTEALNSEVYRKTLLALLKAEPLPYSQTPCAACEVRPKTPEEAKNIMARHVLHYGTDA